MGRSDGPSSLVLAPGMKQHSPRPHLSQSGLFLFFLHTRDVSSALLSPTRSHLTKTTPCPGSNSNLDHHHHPIFIISASLRPVSPSAVSPPRFCTGQGQLCSILKPSPYPNLKSSLDFKPACRAVHVLVYPLSLWGLHDTLSTEGSAQEKTEYVDEF